MVKLRVAISEQRDASYDIVIGRGLLADLPAFVKAACPASRYVVITDSHVAQLYGKQVMALFHDAKLQVELLEFPAGEWNKTRETWALLSDRMLAAQIGRDSAVIALGGGVIGDRQYFDVLEQEHAAVTTRDVGALERVVRRSVEIKAEVVAADEREAGRRAILNFGHTVAHAIEATTKFATLHGEAVAIGMAYEARLAEALGIAEAGTADRVQRLLERYNLPLDLPESATVEALVAAMQLDKKARDGSVRFALPQTIGRMYADGKSWTVAAPENVVRDVLGEPKGGPA